MKKILRCKNCRHPIEPDYYSEKIKSFFHICGCKNSHNFHVNCDICGCSKPEAEENDG